MQYLAYFAVEFSFLSSLRFTLVLSFVIATRGLRVASSSSFGKVAVEHGSLRQIEGFGAGRRELFRV